MPADGPIYIIDDDTDDHDLVREVSKELSLAVPILFFDSGEKLLDHMKGTSEIPFFILCDINLPGMDGFELKLKVQAQKDINIPFIFWSNAASQQQIKKAYDLGAQGVFIKAPNFQDLKKNLQLIIDYWSKSR